MRRRLFNYNNDNNKTPLPQTSIDMGTNDGIKWSIYMLGTTNAFDSGLYFQWGDKKGYYLDEIEKLNKTYDWEDYLWNKYSSTQSINLTKYNTTDGKTLLDLEDDAAHVLLGGKWRMPTKTEFERLKNVCNISYVSNYQNTGISGKLWTSNINNNTLFFPLSGFIKEEGIFNPAETRLWCSTLDTSSTLRDKAYGLSYNNSANNVNSGNRYVGRNIRPVCDV